MLIRGRGFSDVHLLRKVNKNSHSPFVFPARLNCLENSSETTAMISTQDYQLVASLHELSLSFLPAGAKFPPVLAQGSKSKLAPPQFLAPRSVAGLGLRKFYPLF